VKREADTFPSFSTRFRSNARATTRRGEGGGGIAHQVSRHSENRGRELARERRERGRERGRQKRREKRRKKRREKNESRWTVGSRFQGSPVRKRGAPLTRAVHLSGGDSDDGLPGSGRIVGISSRFVTRSRRVIRHAVTSRSAPDMRTRLAYPGPSLLKFSNQ
jgi:hypothetical protein